MALTITAINPSVIGDEGGEELVLTGTFPELTAVKAYLGSAGDETDSPCYGGQGYGYNPMSQDGVTLRVVAAAGAIGSNWLTVVVGVETAQIAVTVVERNFKTATFSMRADYPPWYDAGPRMLDGLPPIGEL